MRRPDLFILVVVTTVNAVVAVLLAILQTIALLT